MKYYNLAAFLFLCFLVASCTEGPSKSKDNPALKTSIENDKQAFTRIVEKHLNAVSNKDLVALKSTLSPRGNMQLIVPGAEIFNSVDSFMNYHREWFKDTTWTFETKILNSEIGEKIGIAITQIIYREPERDGKPYFNRMVVSYGLQKIDNNWYIIKDHASSIEKSTD